jgi:hypothetical protein
MHNYTLKDRVNLFLNEVVKNICDNNFDDADKFLKDSKEKYFKISEDSGLSYALQDKQTKNIDYILDVVQENIAFADWCKKNKIPVIRDEDNKISQETTSAVKDYLKIKSFLDQISLGLHINYLNEL